MGKKVNALVILSILLLGLSLFLTFGVKMVFHACPMHMGQETGKIMPCHWAEQAVFATGIVLSVMSVLLFVFKKPGEKAAISACMIPVTALVFLFPQFIIRLCMKPEMMCRTHMRPAVMGITVALAVVELISMTVNLKKNK